MTNVRTIHVDWYSQRPPRFSGGPQLAYQGDHLSNMVVFDNAPELPNYYLLVEMKTDDTGSVVELPAIMLEGPYWVIPNYYTQICQQITYQVCCKTETGDYEHHSAKFEGTILPTIKHDGEPIDQSPMFDSYIDILDKRVSELILYAGVKEIDSELKSDSENPVQNRVIKAKIDEIDENAIALNGRLQWYPLAVNVTDGSYVVGSTGGIDTNANLSYAEVSVLAFRGKGITIQSYLWKGAGFAFLDVNGAYIYGESANTKGITPDAGELTKVETSVPYNAYSLMVTLHQHTYAANANRYFFTIGENKATKVVFIGDSYGTGFNTGGTTTGWIPGTAAALGLKSSDFEIHAKGGAGFRHPANITPYETFTDLLNLSTLAKAEVGKIVVCGGYNEQLYTVSQLLEAFGTFAAKARTMYPFAEICIGMIGHSGKASEQETLMNTVRQGYMQMANRAGVRYLSNVEYVLTDENVSSDYIHPDQTGADNLATAIGNAVKTGSASGKNYDSVIDEIDGCLAYFMTDTEATNLLSIAKGEVNEQ